MLKHYSFQLKSEALWSKKMIELSECHFQKQKEFGSGDNPNKNQFFLLGAMTQEIKTQQKTHESIASL